MRRLSFLSIFSLSLSLFVPNFAFADEDSSQADEEVVVVGSLASLRSALNKKRDSDKNVGVIDSDALGNFADINVAESLRRISGISVENDQGEGRYVTVRGMNTDLNAMTINGVSTASPEDRRGVILDGVPTDLLDSMTVYKTLTPNLDADTIGGAIDLETISAFSYGSNFVKFKAETSRNDLTKDSSNPKLSGTYTTVIPQESGDLGIAFVISSQERRIKAENNETGGWGSTYVDDDYEMRYYDLTRERDGIVLNLDYVSNSGSKTYLHLFHNEYEDVEYRAKWEVRDVMEEYTPTISGTVATYGASRMDTEGKNRTEIRSIDNLAIGHETQLSNGSFLEVQVFRSEAEQDDTDRYNLIFRSKEKDGVTTLDTANPQKPVLGLPSEFYDASTFPGKAAEQEYALTEDEEQGFKIDYTYMIGETVVQTGLKYRQREKINNYQFCEYDMPKGTTLADYDYQTIGKYLANTHGPAPTFEQVKSIVTNNTSGTVTFSDGTTCPGPGTFFRGMGGDEEEESIPADWTTEEDILALYFMGTTLYENSTWVYGIRFEDTETTYKGKNWNDTYLGDNEFENNYSFAAPSLNIKYDISDDMVLRFGAFRSLVRPGFKESRAGAIINVDDNEIEGGNPNLDPTKATNIDISFEYYIDENTFLGMGAFYKNIEDAIVEVESRSFAMRGSIWDKAETYINADDSSINGLEFSYQTAFDNGFILVANYTYADGETDLPADAAAGQRTIPYFKQVENTWNLSLGYDDGPWDIRLAATYRDNYLDEVGSKPLNDRYTDDHMQVDLTAKYKVNDSLRITFEAINLNDEPEYYYFGNPSRLSQYDEYGATYGVGFRYILNQ